MPRAKNARRAESSGGNGGSLSFEERRWAAADKYADPEDRAEYLAEYVFWVPKAGLMNWP